MAKVYIPKTDHLSPERLKKACADMLKQAREDRNLAKQAYEFFKDIVDNSAHSEDIRDMDARKCMIECLKLMQSAQNTAIKGLDTFIKAEEKLSKSQSTTTMKDEAPPSWKDLSE